MTQDQLTQVGVIRLQLLPAPPEFHVKAKMVRRLLHELIHQLGDTPDTELSPWDVFSDLTEEAYRNHCRKAADYLVGTPAPTREHLLTFYRNFVTPKIIF